jgi:hypothetical protein
MPHRRGNNPSLEIWILCPTPLLVCVPRTPVLTNLVGLLTSHTFSPWLQSARRRSEYANYARKSCTTCQQAYNNSIMLVTNMDMRKFRVGYKIICTRSRPEKQIVVNTSSPATQPSMTRLFRRKIGPTASQLKSPALRLLRVNYANVHFLCLVQSHSLNISFASSLPTIK